MNLNNINNALMRVFQEQITLDGSTVYAIVNLLTANQSFSTGMIIDKLDMSVTMKTADFNLLTVAKGDAATIRGVSYRVLAIMPDDNGLTVITMRPA